MTGRPWTHGNRLIGVDPIRRRLWIGGHYTMDRHDAVQACELIGARTVIPCHYGTFPPIETDDQAFKADVERRTGGEGRRQSTVEILEPGSSLSL